MNVSQIYADAKAKYEAENLTRGMSIFYSPVVKNPKFLVIGDNPGGSEGPVVTSPPTSHAYFPRSGKDDFPLAEKMRLIFEEADQLDELRSSVKLNRVFFRSPNKEELRKDGLWDELKQWCEPHVRDIIQYVEPNYIIAESIDTYDTIRNLLSIKHKRDLLQVDNKSILRFGYSEDYKIFGMYHPSAPWNRWMNDTVLAQIGSIIKASL